MSWATSTAESLINQDELLERARHYAQREGADEQTLACLAEFCGDPVTGAILALPEERLEALLVNDAYKPRMHKLYARYMPGVLTDFELSVRRTPAPLAQIRKQDPQLWQRFEQACRRRLGVPPYPPEVLRVLDSCFGSFRCSQEMAQRAQRDGVAPLSWRDLDGGPVAFSHGPVEASSHVETTLTQLIQELTVAAQVRRLERERGFRLTSTELLASSLAKLALGVARLSAEAEAQRAAGAPQPALMLFAGRRSTSRRYLLVQNWYCMRLRDGFPVLPGTRGTSAVLAVTLLQQLLREQGLGGAPEEGVQQGGPAQRQKQQQEGQSHPQQQEQGHSHQQQQEQGQQQKQQVEGGTSDGQQGQGPPLRLVGTLAHESIMITDQLLGSFDDIGSGTAGGTEGGTGGPVQVCSLLAHLLLLAAGGGVHQATALSDTFGTRGFVSAALAARLPEEFRDDVAKLYPEEWAALPEAVRAGDARVYDLFAWWRMDSGVYEEMAGYVVDAWEQRWAGQPPESRPPRPLLMHSNLESFEEIIECWRLPERIRPAAFAFGTLADGFLPFDCPSDAGGAATSGPAAQPEQQQQRATPGMDGGSSGGGGGGGDTVDIKLCSVVMKAVQSWHPGTKLPRSTESAGKLGDDASASKALFDRRLPPEAVERTRQRLLLLSRERPDLDPAAVSAALAAAYHAVTRDGVLC